MDKLSGKFLPGQLRRLSGNILIKVLSGYHFCICMDLEMKSKSCIDMINK